MLNARPADRCSLGTDGGNSSSLNAGHDASDRRQRTTPQKTKIMKTQIEKIAEINTKIQADLKESGCFEIDGQIHLRLPDHEPILKFAREIGFDVEIPAEIQGKKDAENLRLIENLQREIGWKNAIIQAKEKMTPAQLRRRADEIEFRRRCEIISRRSLKKSPKSPMKGARNNRVPWGFNGNNWRAKILLETIPAAHKCVYCTSRRQKGYFSFGTGISPEAAEKFAGVMAEISAVKS